MSKVRRPGDFYATGSTEIFAPFLEVAGVGPIALPPVSYTHLDVYKRQALKRINEELDKLSILETGSPEYAVTRNYLDAMTELPWGVYLSLIHI